jgi:predicted phage-related endonuclease
MEWAERIPEKYYLQTQQQMLVTGANRCLFGALLWGSKLIWEWVPRDEATIARIIDAGSAFWSRVQRRDPPLSDGHPGARKVLGIRANVDEDVELYEPEIEEMLASYENSNTDLKDLRGQVRRLEKQRDASMDAIAQKMGSSRKGYTATGWSFRWETEERRGYTVEPKTIERFKIKAPKAQ